MYWFMEDSKFELMRAEATKVLEKIGYYQNQGYAVSTDAVIDYIKQEYKKDIHIYGLEFSEIDSSLKEYGAILMMKGPQKKDVSIFLNTGNDKKFQRFSLAHELGHLIYFCLEKKSEELIISTHINYKVTSISKEEWENDEFVKEEQIANVFALKLLIPDSILNNLLDKYTIPDVEELLGVPDGAVRETMKLG